MSIDSFSLYCMIPELRARFLNRPARDVSQPSRFEIVLRFRRREEEESGPILLLSLHPQRARVHTSSEFPKQKQLPHFAATLRQHLLRGELTAIDQTDLDRILTLRFDPPPGLLSEQRGESLLIAEMMGKHSNLILVNAQTNRIIEAAKHVREHQNRHREIVPGAEYLPPPPPKRADPFAMTRAQFDALMDPTDDAPVWKQALERIDGFSPAFAKEWEASAHDGSSGALWAALHERMERLKRRQPNPHVLYNGERAVGYTLFSPSGDPFAEAVRFESVDAAIGAYYTQAARQEEIERARNQLAQAIQRREAFLLKKQRALRGDLRRSEQAENYQRCGELIMSSLHEIPPRAETASVADYYDPDAPKVEIALNPKRSALENAQEYFKKSRKARRGAARIAQLISDLEREFEWVDERRRLLKEADDMESLETQRGEMERMGWIQRADAKGSKREQQQQPYRSFTHRGWTILAGRNDRENEWLVTRVGRKDDMWLHAKQTAGSHVLIRNPERRAQIPMPVLLSAAKLAANMSKARSTKHAPVDYTFLKYVNRPKGAKTGMVVYSREKTLFVDPAPPSELFGT